MQCAIYRRSLSHLRQFSTQHAKLLAIATGKGERQHDDTLWHASKISHTRTKNPLSLALSGFL
jgi:hypothetical protein